jgi:carboxymethylenebutenolidase
MSKVHTEFVEIATPETPVRALVARPAEARGRLPALLAWPDIFQLTPPHVRMARRLAGYGFVVVAPEIFSRIEPRGTVLDFDRDRQRALDAAGRVEPGWLDRETRALLDWSATRPDVDPARLGACGWCFGGHVAMRAALEREVRATACVYPTGLHADTLGAGQGTVATLARASEITGAVLLIWGTADPHIPAAGRDAVHAALERAGTRFERRLYDAEHTFMRDEGARHDPEAADLAFGEMVAHFRRWL